MQKPLLFVTVFFCGMAVMIIELVGSRVIAPYVGTSVYVWTSLIGVLLGSLSLGYYLGGKVADKGATFEGLASILFFAGISTSAIIYLRYAAFALGIFGTQFTGASFIIAPFLFVPATFFFGMCTPYLARLHITAVETSGRTIGRLYALSTVGSIVGTFLGGFVLISFFGNTKILVILGVLTIVLALLIYLRGAKDKTLIALAVLGIAFSITALYLPGALPVKGSLVTDLDTPYKRVWVFDTKHAETGRPTRIFTDTIFGGQSGIYLDNPTELLFDYHKYFDLAQHFNPGAKKALMIGAGVYTYVGHYLEQNPEGTLDVVEIDPQLESIAQEYFGLVPPPGLTIFNEDGRIFLNTTTEVYDAIFMDAFTALLSIPHQLTTQETIARLYDQLDEKGVVIANIISATEGPRSDFLRAELATYKSIFPTVLLFKVHEEASDAGIQNLVLVALKGTNPSLESKSAYLNALLKTIYQKPIAADLPILYDDFAPVEKYNAKLML